LGERLRAGDPAAFSRVYSRYFHSLLAVASRVVKDEEAARDIVQDVFTTIWRDPRKRTWQSLRGFLESMTRSLAIDRYREEDARGRRERRWGRTMPARPWGPDEMHEWRRLERRLTGVIDDLPRRQGEAFVLTQLRGLTHAEAGEEMGISRRTVESHLAAARVALRRRLGPEGPQESSTIGGGP